jgi:hypothetical protein
VYYIFGRIEGAVVVFVGCTRDPNLPADSILLQTVEHHPEVHWVKWSVRFGRTLKDKHALDHPFAKYFKNSPKLTRLFGDQDFEKYASAQNAEFLKFHEKNRDFLQVLIGAALLKKAEGRIEYSIDQLVGEARWGDTEIDRGNDRVKINGKWSAWYSRGLQMAEPNLIGFFAVRSSVADGLVWIDGRSWQQFASEHEDEINWKDPFDGLPDSDWEYNSPSSNSNN